MRRPNQRSFTTRALPGSAAGQGPDGLLPVFAEAGFLAGPAGALGDAPGLAAPGEALGVAPGSAAGAVRACAATGGPPRSSRADSEMGSETWRAGNPRRAGRIV
ncbi:hypothetical protein GCM10010466_21720 [Planomonospora alba]|uniref:Uncharacterized protein n=1 Tax=Planomonospora alba TaxID=161354 RepID=A0ABP6N0X6_9ACTN